MKWLEAARVSVLLLVLLLGDHGGVQGKAARLERWVKAGLQYLKVHLCRRVALPESECRRLAHLHPSGIAVYTSESGSGKVLAILPDSHPAGKASQSAGALAAERGLERERFPDVSAHDAVLVLDPSPGESFGHPVLLFYVDFNVAKKKCAHMEGIYLGEVCMTLALKTRCRNQLKRRRSRSDRTMDRTQIRKSAVARASHTERSSGLCEIHFLPRVVGVRDSNRTQRLRCVDHPEFARCPQPLPLTSPTVPISSCELNKNTRRCHQQPLATHLSCRLYQTCDHAVLLSGGWQEQITYQHHEQNLLVFYQMLRNNGFHKDHIKTFFAGNGQVAAKEAEGMYPATEKEVIRNHISYICRKQHCADTFVLYLNSPTRNDGTMLLWDRNNNGIADLKERYAVGELLADLAGCRANRVLLFVEQSYTGVLTKRLKGSLKHLNVVLLNGLPWVNTAQFWASLLPSHCLIDHLSKNAVMLHVGDGISLLNVTLSGAPCNSTPPLSEDEMKKEYMGCQNLPTALWHQGHRKSHNSERN
ncbi:hypothetical protein PHYPO_G00207490 [Pangasianodon hypophthalmus]|uniref:Uncharacterized protein n=1 Tax=Pangasianodon hypophthalmus TaxID=310915 RepID=A0A5N5PD94_PANHP|nr:uncharacterized protein si:ch211-67e16.11 [Pangasianodon hypophthalmus]KAB5577228.1 hypothetical protein PHYPO_G00207490 [Pangasianodon hypophthalmus]